MSAVVAGMTRGVAEVVDEYLRQPPFGVELHRMSGCRVEHLHNEFIIECSAETARVIWEAYDDVDVTVRQVMIIDGVTSYSNETQAGVKRAGNPFPPHLRFTRRWRGRVTAVDGMFTVLVRVPAGRQWEHNRWLAAGGYEAIRAPPPPEIPEEHIQRMLRGEAVAAGIRFLAVCR